MNQNVLSEGFRLPAGAPPVACVNIGGTKVAVCIADAQGVRGKNGNAGHAGHLFVSDNEDALCGCGWVDHAVERVRRVPLRFRWTSLLPG